VRRSWEAVGAWAEIWRRRILGLSGHCYAGGLDAWVVSRMGVTPTSTMATTVAASFGRVAGIGSSGKWLGHHVRIKIWIWLVACVTGVLFVSHVSY
jgi:hypothetical protein